MPIHAYENKARITDPLLLTQPNPQEDRVDTIFGAVASLLLHGNFYAVPGGYDELANPDFVIPVHPNEVTIRATKEGWLYRINGMEFAPSEIVHVRGFKMPGSPIGLGVIQAQMQALGHHLAIAEFGQRWFSESAIPPGIIHYEDELSQEEAQAIKAEWVAAHARSREPAILTGGAQFKEYGLSPEASQFIESRQLGLTEIANMFGIAGYFLGAQGPTMTYSNTEIEALNLVKHSLMPWMVRLERAFTKLLPEAQYAKFSADAVLRGDTTTRYGSYTVALEGGWLTLDDIKALEEQHE